MFLLHVSISPPATDKGCVTALGLAGQPGPAPGQLPALRIIAHPGLSELEELGSDTSSSDLCLGGSMLHITQTLWQTASEHCNSEDQIHKTW
jgi:hypothetical protein